MTPSEKAVQTRQLHKQKQKEKANQEKEIREKLINGCLTVLDDPTISATERLEALRILHAVTKGR